MSNAALKNARTYSTLPPANLSAAGNNFSAQNDKPLAFSITQHELTERCRKVMREYVGNENDAAKRLACVLECSVGTAKNYLDGRTTPQGIHDLRAMAVIPGWLDEKTKLAGLEMALDPRHQARMAEFMRYCQQAADRIFAEDK